MKVKRLFTKHYAIERFGILFLTLVVLMGVNISTIVVRKLRHDKQSLSGQAVYTSSFVMSRTGTGGTVEGVYVNGDRNECFLLLKFESMADIPVTADSYQMFLTGSSANQRQTDLECHPSAMLYVFGNTGYMGIDLQNAEAFPSQILDLTIRSTKEFKSTENANVSQADGDGSFAKYNQGRIYFNPGGTYALHGEFLDKKDWDIFDAYEEMVSRPAELEARANLRKDLLAMKNAQLLMDEYGERLSGKDMGLELPKAPADISGDRIYAMVSDGSSREELRWSITRNVWQSPTEDILEDQVDLYLDTDFLSPGGYDFDWQQGSVQGGYLQKLTGSRKLSDWDAYFAQHTADAKDRADTFDVSSVRFHFADGTELSESDLVADGSSAGKKNASIAEAVTTLRNAWQTYYDAKRTYQAEHLPELLRIEADAHSIQESYTVNTDEDGSLLTLY